MLMVIKICSIYSWMLICRVFILQLRKHFEMGIALNDTTLNILRNYFRIGEGSPWLRDVIGQNLFQLPPSQIIASSSILCRGKEDEICLLCSACQNNLKDLSVIAYRDVTGLRGLRPKWSKRLAACMLLKSEAICCRFHGPLSSI